MKITKEQAKMILDWFYTAEGEGEVTQECIDLSIEICNFLNYGEETKEKKKSYENN